MEISGGEGVPITVRASGGATVTVNITVNKYFLDMGKLKTILSILYEHSPTRASAAMAMARG